MRKKKRQAQAEQTPEPSGRPRVTPMDVQQKEFRPSFRGYNERDVDGFLDEITEEISLLLDENRRLRDEVGTAPAAPLFRGTDPSGEAEEVVARAREEAARIVREAEARAAVVGTAGGAEAAAAISPFVKVEREFLQSLAGLIQGHAESVKEMVRAARDSQAEAEAARAPVPRPEPVSMPVLPPEAEPATWRSVAEAAKAEPPPTPILRPDRVMILDEAAEPKPQAEVSSAPGEEPEGVAAGAEEAESASVSAEPSGAADEGERSLRDLFWGED
ncbi:MAG: DivIVA domain-containing protein [Actinobacteria bacterium]|nr:DivIVA domain-containing protein [Actinomycetota bacterium]